ncbi:hypothetical protein CC80DRAFT_562052 [Byssothecium circinans]|uniref:Uncharacterized protein n=1 Tax=Byssothecium circinans TaxID=147558 RepID=A0A6A5U5Y6_9PLEO|nr:hypothetical protein CC80DRAFT_562052 [Byssothecium circinans]
MSPAPAAAAPVNHIVNKHNYSNHREAVPESWDTVLSSMSSASSAIPLTVIGVGGEVKPKDPDPAAQRFKVRNSRIQANAGEMKGKGSAVDGERSFEEFYEAWEGFKKKGAVGGVRLKWGEGVEGWEGFCKDRVTAGRGLVYRV